MESTLHRPLPGGSGRRAVPAGVLSGAPLTRIDGPGAALALVAEDLGLAERALVELVQSDVAAVPTVAGYLAASGGKRLRPALTALGARAVGIQTPLPRLMCVGEMIHLGSLLHDDVVDDGLTRRGQPTAHRVYGNAVTVLTGDFCLARAMLLASEEGGHAAVTALGRAVTEMAEGEVLQLQRSGDLGCDRPTYFQVVEKKSAALIAWCCAAGAYAADDLTAAQALEEFGRSVGIAFQITDDVLDYAEGTGKNPGADLRQRKVTLPLLYAMEAVEDLRSQLEGDGELDIAALITRIKATGALDRALSDARRIVEDGIAALDALPESTGREALVVLGHHLVERAS
jgi:octaprenyl-diphosphate synthase